MFEFARRLALGLLLCGVAPGLIAWFIIHHLEITWINIFLVGGLESFFVFLCWDMGKWVREAWDDARNG